MKFAFISLIFGLSFISFLFFANNTYAATHQLSGKITDSSASAISGASIDIIDKNTNTTVSNISSGTDGFYYASLESGTYDVKVTPNSSGLTSAMAVNKLINTDTVLNFTLVNSGAVSFTGKLKNALGEAVPNQLVILRSSFDTVSTTDSSGNFSFEVAPGNYTLVILPNSPNSPAMNVPVYYQIKYEPTWL